MLEDVMWALGYLDQRQMAGAFQMLRSRDLIWSRMVRAYLMGEREQATDLMAWNADATRMPHRMHSEYLRRLYLANDLALERAVVIKALPRRVAGAARQLEEEARAMARVSDSRLAMIFGIEGWQGVPLLVMEYLAGGTLADRLRRGPLDAGDQ